MDEKKYIDKEFVIDTIDELKAKPLPKGLLFDHLKKVIEIFSTKNIQPVKHGHWIKFKAEDSCYVHMRCSECSAYWSDPSHADYFRYCPNCGAKMEGSKRNG